MYIIPSKNEKNRKDKISQFSPYAANNKVSYQNNNVLDLLLMYNS